MAARLKAVPRAPKMSFAAVIATLLPAILLFLAGRAARAQAQKISLAQEHLERARTALRENQPAAAIQEFHAVIALDPNNSEAYGDLGVIAFFRRDCAAASENFRRALAIAPGMVRIKALLGICEMREGNPAARELLESSFAQLKDRKLRVETGLELEELDYRAGDLGRASSLAQALVALAPDNVNVLYMAQRVYSDLSRETLNKLAVLAPGSARMEQAIAERLVNEGDARGAMAHYRKALAIDPGLAGVHFELAECILQADSHSPKAQAAAKNELGAATRNGGDNAGIEVQLGRIALLQLQPDEAIADFSRALAMNPSGSEAALGMGKALLIQQKPGQALKYLRMAVAADPLSGEAHYQLATALRDLHETSQAEKEMRTFTRIGQTTDQVRTLYRQMDRPAPRDQPGAAQPPE